MTQPIDIIVKKIYKNTGKTKAGKEYQLTRLLATDKNYYFTFQSSSVISSIQEGSAVKLEATQDKQYPTNYDIIRIIEVDANPPKQEPTTAGRALPSNPGVHNITAPSPSPLSLSDASKMLAEAISEVQKELPQVDDGELISLIAEHYSAKLQSQQQTFSLAMSNMVQQSKLRNMGMIR